MPGVGQTISHYRILEKIGGGGMGEVYRARDPRVGRDVAIKVSSEQFSDRFTREIHAVAALNHSNVCTLFDVGPNYLVMELVEGPTLADRIKQGPIPLEESLQIARQIADALEAAHEKGIVHRDLKPGNIKIRPDGTVKVLDFGLAKVEETAAVSLETSPTLSVAQTAAGVLLGTAAYMSPEQARGKPVDKRADIWAFGVVLYEMLTGKQLFSGGTVSDTMAAVLREEPDLERVPAKARLLLRRCLEKDPKKRLRDIGDAWQLLESPPEAASARRPLVAWGIAVLALLIAAFALTFPKMQQKPVTAEPIILQSSRPEDVGLGGFHGFALSPDGRRLVFSAASPDGFIRLWVRDLGSLEARQLYGAEIFFYSPIVWSQDSRFVAFDAGGKLKKIDVSGGSPQILSELPSGYAMGGSWNRDGVILFGSSNGGLVRVSAAGGPILPATKLNPKRQETQHIYPVFLPDGRHFLYFCRSGIPENTGVYVGLLDLGPDSQEPERLVNITSSPIYVASGDSGPGHLLFVRDGTLMAQAFDAKRLKIVGEPQPVAEKVTSWLDHGVFSATSSMIIYGGATMIPNSQPTWFDRSGKTIGLEGEKGRYEVIALSPDGRRAAFGLQNDTQSIDLWLRDFSRGVNTRFTYGKSNSQTPVWSPDLTRIVFNSDRDGFYNLYEKPVNGTRDEIKLLQFKELTFATSWSRDGRFLLCNASGAKARYDLWLVPLEGDRKPLPFLNTEFNELDGRFSPDMRWIAYVSDESGSSEVYVRPFVQGARGQASEKGGKWLVSKGGGTGPRWRGDGKELYYRDLKGTVMAIDVDADLEFHAGIPKPLFQVPLVGAAITWGWDVVADGSRFLLNVPEAESSASPFTFVFNWTSLLRK